MTYDQINRLRLRLPKPRYEVANPTRELRRKDDNTPRIPTNHIQKFIACYKDLSFGWTAASLLAKSEAKFPLFPDGNMRWVWLAWRMKTSPPGSEMKAIYDPIHEASVIEYSPEGRETREVIQAMLVTNQITIEKIAEVTGMDRLVIEAYEALFFNVIDRWKDHLMLRNHVYPNSRLEEMTENYFVKSNLGTVLKRIGYNRGMDSLLHYAGFRTNYNQQMSNAQAVEAFQTEMTNQGAQLVRDGFLNYRQSFAPVAATRGLIQARMVGGGETEGTAETGSLNDPFLDQLLSDSNAYNDALREKKRMAANNG